MRSRHNAHYNKPAAVVSDNDDKTRRDIPFVCWRRPVSQNWICICGARDRIPLLPSILFLCFGALCLSLDINTCMMKMMSHL